MSPPLDPYRTLGLSPGASADEIRRAYRRLAKANHPDSAGEQALPRFLAIQAAYEMLIAGRTRPSPGGRRTSRAGPPAGEPWRADPTRARATRNASSRARNAGARGTSGSGAGGAGGPEGTGASGAGQAASGRAEGSTSSSRRGGRRGAPNKATLGSTSYDGAEDEPFEPEWSGGTWYGTSSGTYWTLNPKEYADPRKHGPEYQRRARRRVDGEDPGDDEATFSGEDFAGQDSETATGRSGGQRFDGRWTYPDDAADDGAPDDDPDVIWVRWAPSVPRPRRTPQQVADDLLAGHVGFAGRFLLAFFGCFPIAALLAWLAGEISGCGRFTASCSDPSGIWTAVPVFIVYSILVLAPSVAAVSGAGLLGSLALAVPAAIVLSAGGGSRQPEASSTVLNVLFLVGYPLGVLVAVARRLGWRRVP
jgi:hypothetical protein